jgi:lactoylglutathione lyase
MITGITHQAIRARDAEKTAAFYTEILGLKEAFRMHRPDGTLSTIYLYVAPSQFLEIFSGGSRETEQTNDQIGHCHLCFEVPDAQAAIALFREKGAPIDSEVRTGISRCIQFWTHDPDGNKIELMQLPPESLQAQANERFR